MTKFRNCVLTIFGTRPEVIKLAPILMLLEHGGDRIRAVNVASGQHPDLVPPLVAMFRLRVDFHLRPRTGNDDPETMLGRVVQELLPIFRQESPDLVIVQGDTATALAGAMAGRLLGVPVAHVEAGLRSGDIRSPYPEELYRTRITQLATYHFAPTRGNRDLLLQEGISEASIFVTGNSVVDALHMVLPKEPGLRAAKLLAKIAGRRYILLTTHRRESFNSILEENLCTLREFVEKHHDVVLLFPVHPNPVVRAAVQRCLTDDSRIILTEPLQYPDFLYLLSRSWLAVSDSGGIQEEVAVLGKPFLLILRTNTERPECIEAGLARLVGGRSEHLLALLEEAYLGASWVNPARKKANPFGDGKSAERIVNLISVLLNQRENGARYEQGCGLQTVGC